MRPSTTTCADTRAERVAGSGTLEAPALFDLANHIVSDLVGTVPVTFFEHEPISLVAER